MSAIINHSKKNYLYIKNLTHTIFQFHKQIILNENWEAAMIAWSNHSKLRKWQADYIFDDKFHLCLSFDYILHETFKYFVNCGGIEWVENYVKRLGAGGGKFNILHKNISIIPFEIEYEIRR